MDTIPIEANRLAALVGDWTVAGTLTADGKPAAVSGHWRYVAVADGWGLRGALATEIEGLGSFEECELIGFDPAEGKVHLTSMNRYAVRDHVGYWVDETHLSVVYRGKTAAGGAVTEQIDICFDDADEITSDVVETVDGAVAITTELRMIRQR